MPAHLLAYTDGNCRVRVHPQGHFQSKVATDTPDSVRSVVLLAIPHNSASAELNVTAFCVELQCPMRYEHLGAAPPRCHTGLHPSRNPCLPTRPGSRRAATETRTSIGALSASTWITGEARLRLFSTIL